MACAWLPEECVATPFASFSLLSDNTAFIPPRILKAPIFWKFSHLKKISAPAILLMVELVRTGVLCMYGLMRSCASRIDSLVTLVDSFVICMMRSYGTATRQLSELQ